jgi:type II secretory pathway pseudopilin PulG
MKISPHTIYPPRRREGFTVIELILVMGILLFLMAMFFVGLNYVTATAQKRDTASILETAKSMFSEYQQATHLSRIPAGTWQGTAAPATYSGTIPTSPWSWTFTETLPVPPPWAIGQITPSLQSSNAWTNSTLGVDTAAVMYAMEQIPSNQAIITNLPASKKLTVSGVNVYGTTLSSVTFLLDSWGNPILFVPSGGLANVRFGGQTSTVTGQSAVGTTAVNGSAITITSPDSRPFFVSAGPDGDVSQGDDNVYSFQ